MAGTSRPQTSKNAIAKLKENFSFGLEHTLDNIEVSHHALIPRVPQTATSANSMTTLFKGAKRKQMVPPSFAV